MSGPVKTPTEILKIRGSWRAKTRKGEPQPTDGLPAAPRWLGKEEQSVWRAMRRDIESLGVGRLPDANALARYCCLWVRWKVASLFLAAHGESYELLDIKGNVRCHMPYPQVATVNKLSILLLRIEQEFGLTPAARARLSVDVSGRLPKEDGKLSKIIG